MTTSAIYNAFNPQIVEHFEEAVERAGMDPAAIGERHIDSLYRSLKYMLNSEWHTLGMRQWMIKYAEYTVTQGLATFPLLSGAIDIFDAVLFRNSVATPINRMSRSEYLEIPQKVWTGRPDRYFVDRQTIGPNVYVWRTPENSTDIIQYYYFSQMALPGSMANTLDMPPHALQAFVSGLAARFAEKFNKAEFPTLWEMYCGGSIAPGEVGGVLLSALEEDRERADVSVTISLNPRGGRRWGRS